MSAISVSPLEAHLGYWLRHVSNNVSQAFARALGARELSVAEWVVLRLVYQWDRMTPAQLAESTRLTRGAISKVIGKLDDKACLERTSDPDDGRVQWISLSRRGNRLVPALAKLADENDAYFFSCLSGADRATLMRLLRRLTECHGFPGSPVE